MSVVEVYECDDYGVHASQGPDDGLPEGWQANVDDMHFCPPCLVKRPLDAHECDNDMCCYGATAPRVIVDAGTCSVCGLPRLVCRAYNQQPPAGQEASGE